MRAETSWHGHEIELRVKRAIGRANISIAEQISANAKVIVHKQTGTLARSIHVSLPDQLHLDDQERAAAGAEIKEPLTHEDVVNREFIALTEVGSWIAYACVEETGRQHFYMAPAFELVAPTWTLTIEEAFRQEGL